MGGWLLLLLVVCFFCVVCLLCDFRCFCAAHLLFSFVFLLMYCSILRVSSGVCVSVFVVLLGVRLLLHFEFLFF